MDLSFGDSFPSIGPDVRGGRSRADFRTVSTPLSTFLAKENKNRNCFFYFFYNLMDLRVISIKPKFAKVERVSVKYV